MKNPSKKTAKKSTKRRLSRVAVSQCVGYVRVSTNEQADSGLSLEYQKTRIRAQCEANDWQLIGIYEDAGVSAKNLERPALQAALKQLAPGRVLLALKLDRLTRSVRDLYELTARISDAGAEWGSVQEKFDTSTASGRLMLGIMVELSQWEREVIGERTAAALGEKQRRGEHLGAPPLGYRVLTGADGGKIVVEDENELATVALCRQWHAQGVGLREMARRLTDAGHKTKRGGNWEATTVRRLLKTRYMEEIQSVTNSVNKTL